jgi:phenylalanyl-tRNA synthetase alpha chain
MPEQPPPASAVREADLEEITRAATAAFRAAADLDALRAAEATHLGRRSALGDVQRRLGQLDPDARRTAGAQVNAVRAQLDDALAHRRAELEAMRDTALLEAERLDVTLPGRRPPRGAVHLLNRTADEVVDIFLGLGYHVAEGPEVETDWYNFEALNFPPDHPARSEQDAIWAVEPDGTVGRLVLRTHTSPVQVRSMEAATAAARAGTRGGLQAAQPGLYVVAPGRCYRADTPDATHMPVFQQIEVLAVDEGITMGDMKGTLQAFARAYFGPTRDIRLRPSYFPFVEPGAEIDVSCFVCDGRGGDGRGGTCRTCRGEGWIELLGAGMVHPDVLAAGGYDPDRVSGFAAGMGTERLYMLRSGLADIRTIYDNDVRWLATA